MIKIALGEISFRTYRYGQTKPLESHFIQNRIWILREGIAYLKRNDKLLTKQSTNSTNDILSILAAQRKANLPAL